VEKIIILGNSGHALSITDAIERQGKYKIAGYVVNDEIESKLNYPIIGKDYDLQDIFNKGIDKVAIGIGYLGKSDIRERLYIQLKNIGFKLPVICDPSAIISEHTVIGEGTFIGKGAIVNSNACIGNVCIINTGAIVEHDCIVDDFSHVAVGTVLCGEVKIGKSSFIGANATVIQSRYIGERCIVGAGTIIKDNMGDNRKMVNNKSNVRNIGGGISRTPLMRRCVA
jgi:sugar O-acyltransferase (sialic acid O-acetyltransferase NeuD family)